ncbi:hypothetical protein [Ammoniphilus sp. CFH 90114]|uniref:hypothetical protein n=1 Tax=Ammoniphilus sp. CFH 90114 TaxID=2493665 RepID=UPI00100F030C|nr:hypothetical protein [Ammoniphilus sp. CFH 90114]RXT13675.1 hypothetical protein EIZ39_05870 [Ammoniphilus sp. CFH 90114]
MPNNFQNPETHVVEKPARAALGQSNTITAQSSSAISEAQTALNQALFSITQLGAEQNPQVIQQVQEQLILAEEMLDQAHTNAIAANMPPQE